MTEGMLCLVVPGNTLMRKRHCETNWEEVGVIELQQRHHFRYYLAAYGSLAPIKILLKSLLLRT